VLGEGGRLRPHFGLSPTVEGGAADAGERGDVGDGDSAFDGVWYERADLFGCGVEFFEGGLAALADSDELVLELAALEETGQDALSCGVVCHKSTVADLTVYVKVLLFLL